MKDQYQQDLIEVMTVVPVNEAFGVNLSAYYAATAAHTEARRILAMDKARQYQALGRPFAAQTFCSLARAANHNFLDSLTRLRKAAALGR